MNRAQPVALRCYNATMIKWEYAKLVQRRVRNRKDPAKPGWVSSSIVYPEPEREEQLDKLEGWWGNVDLPIMQTLNRLGGEGWELMNIEIYNAAWSGEARWQERSFWLKRPKEGTA